MDDQDNFEEELDAIEERDHSVLIAHLGGNLGNLFIESGYDALEDIDGASDAQLRSIAGVGPATLSVVREAVARYMLEGVSEEPATVPSEVKPVSTDAETAEGAQIAEVPSADEAPVADAAPAGATAVRSLFPSTVRLTAPSGSVYLWERAGTQVNVAAADLEFVMGKNRNTGRACCGGSGGRRYFELA